jgi:hypothetical protein
MDNTNTFSTNHGLSIANFELQYAADYYGLDLDDSTFASIANEAVARAQQYVAFRNRVNSPVSVDDFLIHKLVYDFLYVCVKEFAKAQ